MRKSPISHQINFAPDVPQLRVSNRNLIFRVNFNGAAHFTNTPMVLIFIITDESIFCSVTINIFSLIGSDRYLFSGFFPKSFF